MKRSALVLLVSLILPAYACAADSDWNWTWIQLGPNKHIVFSGTAVLERSKSGFKATLSGSSNVVDPFTIKGVMSRSNVRIVVTPPNRDSGDFLLPLGKRATYKLDPYSTQEVIWAADPVTGDYLALSRNIKRRTP